MINKCSEREVYDRNSFYKTPLFSLNFGSLWPSSVISDIPNSLLQLYHEEPSVFTPLSTLEDIENHFYKREEYTRLFVQTYTRSYVQNYLQNLLYEESLSGSELSAERFISIIVYLAVYIRTFLVAHIGSFMYSMNYKVLHGMISSELSNAANETGLQVDTQSINNALVPVLYDFDILLATPATAVVNESGSVDNTGQ
ncbi:uncharacterized protein LOC135120765 [Zophobas morio]|uniref:uncharacterized protein LOC135120765 n=1 Tax=Zophobas morio TaxID=2755281 RepID=UPI0030833310